MKPDDLDDLYEPGVWAGRIAFLAVGVAVVGLIVLVAASMPSCGLGGAG